MPKRADGGTGDVTTKELDSEFGLEGNTDADGHSYTPEGSEVAEGADDVRLAAPDTDEIQRETRELESLRNMDSDNVAIYERELELQRKKEEEAKAAEEAPETEEGAELEGEQEEPEEEPEAEEPEESEEEEPEGPTNWQEWLEQSIEDPEQRQELFLALADDENLTVPYRANGQELREPLKKILEKASGYEGQRGVQKLLEQANTKEAEVSARAQQLQDFAERLDGLREHLSASMDDPKAFSRYLAQYAELDYLEQLRDNLDQTIESARTNPETFQLRRELAEIKELLGGAAGPAHGGTGKPSPTPDAQPATDGAKDFGFVAGQGYPASHSTYVSQAVREMVADTEVSYDDVVKRWDDEGRKRPIFQVARGLMGSRTRDSRKREVAEIPPVPKSPRRGRPRSGAEPTTPETQEKNPLLAESWDEIPNKLAAELQRLQQQAET